jgi:hypothetical protein
MAIGVGASLMKTLMILSKALRISIKLYYVQIKMIIPF